MITLSTPQPTLGVSSHGAEPRSLRDAHGRELLWQAGGPWYRSAYLLFPAGSLVPLRRSHFDESAVLFPDVADTAIVYRRLDGAGPRVRIAWEGFDAPTLWSAAGS